MCIFSKFVIFRKMSANTKKHLSLLFDRPQEPVFVAKGDEKTVFDIPNNYLVRIFLN